MGSDVAGLGKRRDRTGQDGWLEGERLGGWVCEGGTGARGGEHMRGEGEGKRKERREQPILHWRQLVSWEKAKRLFLLDGPMFAVSLTLIVDYYMKACEQNGRKHVSIENVPHVWTLRIRTAEIALQIISTEATWTNPDKRRSPFCSYSPVGLIPNRPICSCSI